MPYKTKDDLPHTPARRKQVVDLYKVINQKFRADSPYNKDDVIRAARAYLIHGTMTGAAKETGVPYTTIQVWAKKDYWPILLEEIKYLRNIELDGKFTTLIDRTLKNVEERLVKGDSVVVKGEIVNKPVSARDSALIAAIMFDKRQILRGDPTQIQQKNFNVDERLEQLQQTFDKLARRAEEKVVAEIPAHTQDTYPLSDTYENISEAELVEQEAEGYREAEQIKELVHFDIDVD